MDLKIQTRVNYSLSLVELFFSNKRLRVWKTLWINFRTLPFRQALKLPISVYGKLKVISLYGKIIIDAPVKRGMIKLGVKGALDLEGSHNSVIENRGTIIFRGDTIINNGFLLIVSTDSTLEFGKDICINNNLVIHAFSDIKIGSETRAGYNVKLISSDFHYSIDTESRTINLNRKPIIIGNNNWITSDIKIMKGTVTPPWTIVMSNSLLNKDYTKIIAENSIIGGQPAKLLKEGQRRVFSLKNEEMLNSYFADNSKKVFSLSPNINLDEFCKR